MFVLIRMGCVMLLAGMGLLALHGTAQAQTQAFELAGTKTIWLHPRDGAKLAIGSVVFTPATPSLASVKVAMKHDVLKDYFLSMREFKCAEGRGEVLCHVPYPHPNPATVSPTDLAWLEHALLFMFKLPSEFGAKLWNGVYFKLNAEGGALVGTPQAVDLNQIGAPPAKPNVPPYTAAKRDEISSKARWFNKLSIE
jgi:hypothetical protein